MFSPGQLTVWGDPLDSMLMTIRECPECFCMDHDHSPGCSRPVSKMKLVGPPVRYLQWCKDLSNKLAKRNTIVKTNEDGFVALFDKDLM
jgi:hypothetical protein